MKNLLFLCLFLAFTSCLKVNDGNENYTIGGGVLIVNEGNFNAGNGSVSFLTYDSLKIYNNLFSDANGRPLGDVPNSIAISSGKAYIVVNNSGKIEVTDAKTLKSIATITGLNSPRNVAIINKDKAYVTSLYSNNVAIVDLAANKVSGSIDVGGSSEAILLSGSKVYVSNWLNGKTIRVINIYDNKVIDTLEVGHEPESMVLDRNNRLWVLCPGGWMRDNYAEIDVIDTKLWRIEKKYVFPNIQDSPSCLKIDAAGQNLYYIKKGVYQMDINASELPSLSLIPENNAYFNKIALNPVNGDILVTDAVDFTHEGYVNVYKNDGTLLTREKAGIIPGSMVFNLTINPGK